jgi:hypothetical protein
MNSELHSALRRADRRRLRLTALAQQELGPQGGMRYAFPP